jgi:Ca2+-binding RTX toxin-like protein
VTPNGSSTTGPNLDQNYPVLTSAITNGTTTTVTGTLTGAAKTAYRVEFFATPTADPSGHGQGQTYLGFGTVTTNAKGTASFTITLTGTIAPGQYITATATDPKDNTSEFAADVLDSSVELVPDAFNPKVTDLVVTSPSGNNSIVVSLAARGAGETVTINGVNRGTYKPTNAIEVYGMAGNDKITIQSQVTLPAYINGGNGNDTLQAGGGPSILYGGSGNDVLIGGTGRNILIGGTGTDTLDSGGTGSILIGGTTIYDGNLQALWAIMAEWSQANVSYATRVAQLNGTQSGGLNGAYVLNTTTVQADSAVDTLVGTNPALKTGALDWFFATSQDKVTRRRTAEVITLLP